MQALSVALESNGHYSLALRPPHHTYRILTRAFSSPPTAAWHQNRAAHPGRGQASSKTRRTRLLEPLQRSHPDLTTITPRRQLGQRKESLWLTTCTGSKAGASSRCATRSRLLVSTSSCQVRRVTAPTSRLHHQVLAQRTGTGAKVYIVLPQLCISPPSFPSSSACLLPSSLPILARCSCRRVRRRRRHRRRGRLHVSWRQSAP